MRDPLRVRVSGPLEAFVAGFVAELGDRGFARVSVVAQVQLVAHLSRWMAAQRVAPAELTGDVIERFVESRRGCWVSALLDAGRGVAPARVSARAGCRARAVRRVDGRAG